MDVELFMSGTPAGESFWGKEEERNYFGTLYNSGKDKPKMLVQVRKAQSGKTYCYYNYLVYDGVVASDGRAGSFFCVSLRTDCYCRDYGNMYSLLDGIFRERIVGHFLKRTQGGALKYEIANFDSVSTEIKGIFEEVMRRMRGLFSGESFTGLDGFATQSSTIARVNLYDCTEEKVAGYVKRNGAVELSPYFPSEKESAARREGEAKLKAANETFEKEKGEMSKTISAERGNVSKLKSDIERRDAEIERLKGEVRRLNEELKRMGNVRRMDEIAKEVKKPMEELLTAMKSVQTQTAERAEERGWRPTVRKVGDVLRWILPTVNFIAVILLLWLALRSEVCEEKSAADGVQKTEQVQQAEAKK